WFHSTPSSVEARLTPSLRATSAAAAQGSSGIAAFPLRLRRHSSKRAFTSSRLTVGFLLRGMVFLLARTGGRKTLSAMPGGLHASLPETHFIVDHSGKILTLAASREL